jgi:hypothetical protein
LMPKYKHLPKWLFRGFTNYHRHLDATTGINRF